jgi:TolB-like protein/DNA-binding winged helix-turn-helix (wHTH) protein
MKGAEGENAASHAFGPWHFDVATGDLSDGTTTTRLEPQVARLLHYFLSHQNTLVSRDQLIAAVWDDRIVSDDAINRCISILRQRLTPEDRNAYIETVVRRGFISHFPPPVEAAAAADEEQPTVAAASTDDRPAETRLPARKAWALGGLAGVLALAAFVALRMSGEGEPPARDMTAAGTPMVAVLPFISAELAGDSEFFARGVHDDLLTQLAQLESIRVISRTSVSEYRGAERNIREIGRELGADAILEGGVQRIGDQIRINAQLIDTRSDVHLWAQQYDRELTTANIFSIQAEIARSIAAAMNRTLSPQDATQLSVLPTGNMAAYRAYHEAMELRETRTISAPAYIAGLERAVALDPGFVRAWAELAGALSFANIRQRDPEQILRLERMLEHIRTLAPDSWEYLVAQSYYTYYVLKDHDRAFALVSQARALRPSDVHVLELQSWIQRRQGDIAGSIESIRQGQMLDPRSSYWTTRLVYNLLLAHRYDEAGAEIAAARIDNYGLSWARSMLQMRDHRDPRVLLDQLARVHEEFRVEARPLRLWEAYVAARDYAGATAFMDAFEAGELGTDAWRFAGIPDVRLARIITNRLQQGSTPQDGAPAGMPEHVEAEGHAEFGEYGSSAYLAMGLVAAAEGDAPATERLVRAWFREANKDLAELVIQRHYACRALGMAAAVDAAVECLRSALSEPSQAMPFIEPFLPYYDAMRDDARFVALLAEIERS